MGADLITAVIAVAVIAWGAGMFVGMFTAKFISKKECGACKQQLWDRIDAIQDIMAGGKITFELRMMKNESA